jgi:hypothetical protein
MTYAHTALVNGNGDMPYIPTYLHTQTCMTYMHTDLVKGPYIYTHRHAYTYTYIHTQTW